MDRLLQVKFFALDFLLENAYFGGPQFRLRNSNPDILCERVDCLGISLKPSLPILKGQMIFDCDMQTVLLFVQ